MLDYSISVKLSVKRPEFEKAGSELVSQSGREVAAVRLLGSGERFALAQREAARRSRLGFRRE
jgi:tRNA U54 and U55 pseudouridine synthase Pus10